MVPCHICDIYGMWKSEMAKRWRDALKSYFRKTMHATRGGGSFYGKRRGEGITM